MLVVVVVVLTVRVAKLINWRAAYNCSGALNPGWATNGVPAERDERTYCSTGETSSGLCEKETSQTLPK